MVVFLQLSLDEVRVSSKRSRNSRHTKKGSEILRLIEYIFIKFFRYYIDRGGSFAQSRFRTPWHLGSWVRIPQRSQSSSACFPLSRTFQKCREIRPVYTVSDNNVCIIPCPSNIDNLPNSSWFFLRKEIQVLVQTALK